MFYQIIHIKEVETKKGASHALYLICHSHLNMEQSKTYIVIPP